MILRGVIPLIGESEREESTRIGAQHSIGGKPIYSSPTLIQEMVQ